MSMKSAAAAMEPDGEIRSELATLLGKDLSKIGHIRKHDDAVALLDVAMAVTGKNSNDAGKDLRCVFRRYPELQQNMLKFKFPGRGQRDTPIVKLAKVIEIIMLLPGSTAATLRLEAAKLIVRYLGGDLRLIDEVRHIRHVQEQLALQERI